MTAPTKPLYRGQRPERRGVSRSTVIEEAKAKVATIDLADLLCGPGQMKRVGDEWVARCPLPDHQDKVASFSVNPEKNVWYCFGACMRGGDAVDLAAAAWGYGEGEIAMAAADLLREFGHEIPQRPAGWYRRQRRQKPVKDALEQIKVDHIRRRLFRLLWPMLERIPDEGERNAEAETIWGELEHVAADMLARREDERL